MVAPLRAALEHYERVKETEDTALVLKNTVSPIPLSLSLLPHKIGIRESVDSLCRDDADMPMPPYIRKAYKRPNTAFASLFR